MTVCKQSRSGGGYPEANAQRDKGNPGNRTVRGQELEDKGSPGEPDDRELWEPAFPGENHGPGAGFKHYTCPGDLRALYLHGLEDVKTCWTGFPTGHSGEESACNGRDPGSIPG